jgi:iron(II)-dependent oxidoreductase
VARNADWTPVIQTFAGVEMVLVPPGCFMMGSTHIGGNSVPVVEQCIERPFWIDRIEVTNGQYGSPGDWPGDDRPRSNVRWSSAQAHCEGRGARLPTELEWEYAARGPDNLIFPWGDTFVFDNAVHAGNSGDHPAAVGSMPGDVSWVGALDMGGNLAEWTHSIFSPYPYDDADGREADWDSDSASLRAARGGWFRAAAGPAQSADRRPFDPWDGSPEIGFRCARDA